ncbi:MAG: hypothetical protein K0Q49_259 [Haloplasmataceae bacterium]|jgi:glycerophosphoryl diester phosphodiesterase|nr:hypothetical protein [Haloplasmataceae bacterium]
MLNTIRVNLNNENTKLIAHRGLSGLAPENTMPAFQLAVENKYYGIECDFHVLKDGNFAVFHDSTLERMTGNNKLITDLTALELNEVKIISGNNIQNYVNVKIPLLNELLELCSKSNLVPIVEIKTVRNDLDLDRVVELVKQYHLYQKVIFISFNLNYLLYLRNNYPDLSLQYLFGEITDEILNICITYKLDIDVNRGKLTKEQIELCQKNNLVVNVWTVDDPALGQYFIDSKVDFITTNILCDK